MFSELLLLCYIRCVVLALGLLHLQWLDCVLYERTLTFTVIDISFLCLRGCYVALM